MGRPPYLIVGNGMAQLTKKYTPEEDRIVLTVTAAVKPNKAQFVAMQELLPGRTWKSIYSRYRALRGLRDPSRKLKSPFVDRPTQPIAKQPVIVKPQIIKQPNKDGSLLDEPNFIRPPTLAQLMGRR